jgi:hypothetical protein
MTVPCICVFVTVAPRYQQERLDTSEMHFVCSSLNTTVFRHMLKIHPNLNPVTTKEVVRAWGVAIRVHFDASNAPITMRKEEAVGPAGAQSLKLYYIFCV